MRTFVQAYGAHPGCRLYACTYEHKNQEVFTTAEFKGGADTMAAIAGQVPAYWRRYELGVSAGFHVSLHKFSNLIISEFPHIINFTQIPISSQKL